MKQEEEFRRRLVGGLEHEFYFPYIGKKHPNCLSYFSEGRLNHQPEEQQQPVASPQGHTWKLDNALQ